MEPSLPYIEPHYVRRDTNGIYYPAGRSMTRMYKKKLINENQTADVMKSWRYEQFFNAKFSISFRQSDKEYHENCLFIRQEENGGEMNISDRSGHDIASAISILIKQVVVDLLQIRHLMLWSDSCVSQQQLPLGLLTPTASPHHGLSRSLSASASLATAPSHTSTTFTAFHRGRCLTRPVLLIHHLKALAPRSLPMLVRVMREGEFFDFKTVAQINSRSKVKFVSSKEVCCHQ